MNELKARPPRHAQQAHPTNKRPTAELVVGRITITARGNAFFKPQDPELPEIAIEAGGTGTAANEDTVLVRSIPPARRLRQAGRPWLQPGTVVRVLVRRRARVVGILQERGATLHVIPDDPCAPHPIEVQRPHGSGLQFSPGEKVVVEIDAPNEVEKALRGRVVEVLGLPDDPSVQTRSVLRQFDLPEAFSPDIVEEARACGTAVSPKDLVGRRDCRRDLVLTIDPAHARDLDDAFCLRPEGPDRWRLWVHVADVAHYVRPGSRLDAEARVRGNSTYLPDRVIPMLPESLSNGLCSLLPGVDRLTHCVEIELTGDGRVLRSKVYSAVIRSHRRMSYEEAGAMLTQPPAADRTAAMLHAAHALAQGVRRARFAAGALPMDVPETRLRLDASGRVTGVDRVEHDAAHQLIEEFMLLANAAVALQLRKAGREAIHRVHEAPDRARLDQYRQVVLRSGIPCGDLRKREELTGLLDRLQHAPGGAALRIGLLKTLERARYAVEPLGHYGLAKADYAHFTSPIRRYADLIVHRSLRACTSTTRGALHQIAAEVSDAERNSSLAERESRLVKVLAFLARDATGRAGAQYCATVLDVRAFGLLVDVPDLGVGGVLRVRAPRVGGPSRHRSPGIGDQLKVRVLRVDTSQRRVEFSLCNAR